MYIYGQTNPIVLADIPQPSSLNYANVRFVFIDSEIGAQIAGVNLNVTAEDGSFSDSGTYDYHVTYSFDKYKYYNFNATKSGYYPFSGRFYLTEDRDVIVILVPVTIPISDSVNNTALGFIVTDSQTGEAVIASVTVNGQTKTTNSYGYVSFEVAKNNSYNYIVQASGYYSKSGVANVGTEPVLVSVELDPVSSTPSPTPTSGTGSGTGTSGYTFDPGLREAAVNTLAEFYQVVPSFFGLVFLLFFLATLNGIWGRRR